MENKSINKRLLILIFSILLNGCLNDESKYYESSKKIKNGMSINDVIKIMNGTPYHIFDIENKATDKKLRLEFIYYDKRTEQNIFITFNDSLKVVMVGQDD